MKYIRTPLSLRLWAIAFCYTAIADQASSTPTPYHPVLTLPVPTQDPWLSATVANFTDFLESQGGANYALRASIIPRQRPDFDTGVIGTDDRQFFTSTASPHRSIGRLEVLSLSSQGRPTGLSICTATLIGPRHLATASHCLDTLKNPNLKIRFQPGFDECEDTTLLSTGGVFVQDIISTPWDVNGNGCAKYVDLAVLILQSRLGDELGFLPISSTEDTDLNQPIFESLGYPTDFGDAKRLTRQTGVTVLSASFCGKGNPMWTNADAGFGMSGGPLLRSVDGRVSVVGVLSTSVVSGELRRTSYSGGVGMVEAVGRARELYP